MTDITACTWTRFAALGDSITEGWCDPVIGSGEPWFGWAGRLALELDRHQRALGSPRLEFATSPCGGAELGTGIAQLARSGATVLHSTAYDPGSSPYLRMLRGRAAVFTAHIHAIAAKHGCRVLDLLTIPGLADRWFRRHALP